MCGPIAPSRAPRSNWRCAARACRSRWSKSPFTNADPKPAFPTSMSNIPEQLRYAASHEWISVQGDIGTVGITDHAQHELSDVVYVDLPKVGAQIAAGAGGAGGGTGENAAGSFFSPARGGGGGGGGVGEKTPVGGKRPPCGGGGVFV